MKELYAEIRKLNIAIKHDERRDINVLIKRRKELMRKIHEINRKGGE